MKLLTKLQGKRTYIITFIMAVLNLLVAFEVISVENLETINVVLAALGLGTLRAGIANS